MVEIKDYKIDLNEDSNPRHLVVGLLLSFNDRYCLLPNSEGKYRPLSGHIYNSDIDPINALNRVASRYGLELTSNFIMSPREEVEWPVKCPGNITIHYTYTFNCTASDNSLIALINKDKRVGLYTLDDVKRFRMESKTEPKWTSWFKLLEQ